LIDASASCLVVIDVQERLVPAIAGHERIVANAGLVMRAAARLGVPSIVTEQYPQGLGPSVAALAALAPDAPPVAKVTFSCLAEPAFAARFRALDRDQAVLLGTEAHVCVLQSAMDLLGAGTAVFVVADAVGSRDPGNARAALDRLSAAGAQVVSAEMVVFEWLRRAASDAFRDLLPAIKGGPGGEAP